MKYIDADRLRTEIERQKRENLGSPECVCDDILSFIDSLRQEQPKDKQVIIITESHGNANIKWDCRSLNDVRVLLKSAESFITEKQIEEIVGPGNKCKQEQPEVDIEKEIDDYFLSIERWQVEEKPYTQLAKCARHFFELGLKAKEESK